MKQPGSNPLRQELARSQVVGAHPEADLLAAFAEGALLARERESVLAHLASCSECREVVSLASAAAPLPDAHPQPSPRRARLPRLAWLPLTATAAGVVVVGMVLMVHRPPALKQEAPVAVKESAKAPPTAAQQQPTAPPLASKTAAAPPAPGVAPNLARSERGTGDRVGEVSKAPDVGGLLGGVVPPAAPPAQAQAQEKASQMTSLQARSVQSENANVDNLGTDKSRAWNAREPAPLVNGGQLPVGGPRNQMTNNQATQNQIASARPAPNKSTAFESQPGGAAGSTTSYASSAPPAAMRKGLKDEAAHPQWRISDAGRVEYSSGDGWHAVLTGAPVKLRVVAVSGSAVWVGGEGLWLCHSSDDGATWTAVQLPAKGAAEQAIIHIRFRTALAGTIESDAGTTWVTTDGGKTWH